MHTKNWNEARQLHDGRAWDAFFGSPKTGFIQGLSNGKSKSTLLVQSKSSDQSGTLAGQSRKLDVDFAP